MTNFQVDKQIQANDQLKGSDNIVISPKKFKSTGFIGLHFMIHALKKPFPFFKTGLKRFLNNYRQDHIFALSDKERAQMPSYSHCMTCKLCDLNCPKLASDPQFISPSYLVNSFSRSLTDLRLSNTLDFCVGCQQCEQICPENVPIMDILHFVKAKQVLSDSGKAA
ncbi:MAG: hypothetical protein H7A33_04990 [Deltaproteobacteria bacterium]|nr:hypothetical protein [Deltaproteobacteria bacterium]